jgi:hypothetical protein
MHGVPSTKEIRSALSVAMQQILDHYDATDRNAGLAALGRQRELDRPLPAAFRYELLLVSECFARCGGDPKLGSKIYDARNQPAREVMPLLVELKDQIAATKLKTPDSLPDRLIGFLVAAAGAARESTEPKRHRKPRLTVKLREKTITLDGKAYDVRSLQALRWVKVLADRPGEWVSSKSLQEFDEVLKEVRPDKLRTYLPHEISSLIESRTGAGSRLRF